MKKIASILMACACMLTPRAAHADDGGFWDNIYHWDTKFFAVGTDIHIYCRDQDGTRVQDCDEWFRNIGHIFSPSKSQHTFKSFEGIEHEVNLRVAFMWSYGDSVPDSDHAEKTGIDAPRVLGLKAMALYNHRFNRNFELDGGVGTIQLFGKDGVERSWRPLIQGDVTFGLEMIRLPKIMFARVGGTYMWGTIPAAAIGHPESTTQLTPEAVGSLAIGFDLRRDGAYGR